MLAARMVISRAFCTKSPLKAEKLLNRKLLLVKGTESAQFLQGLVTNDMNHLSRGNPSIYTMFLNKGGRILFDSIVYRAAEDSYLVEVDSELAGQLLKHLKVYRVRRKIDLEVDEKEVWVVFDGGSVKLPKSEGLVCTDPRLKNLGTRVLLTPNEGIDKITQLFGTVEPAAPEAFREHRYRLGIGEGRLDYPQTKSFPLEGNVDYLNGVSFHKGCYVGQELTARTQHTGVVRKRLMPLKFPRPLNAVDPFDLPIENEQGQNVGKLRGYCNGIGLALIRIEPALAATKCQLSTGEEVIPYKPFWWPTSQPAEKLVR